MIRDWESIEDYEGVGVYETGSHEGAARASSPFVAFGDVAPALAPVLDQGAVTVSRRTDTLPTTMALPPALAPQRTVATAPLTKPITRTAPLDVLPTVEPGPAPIRPLAPVVAATPLTATPRSAPIPELTPTLIATQPLTATPRTAPSPDLAPHLVAAFAPTMTPRPSPSDAFVPAAMVAAQSDALVPPSPLVSSAPPTPPADEAVPADEAAPSMAPRKPAALPSTLLAPPAIPVIEHPALKATQPAPARATTAAPVLSDVVPTPIAPAYSVPFVTPQLTASALMPTASPEAPASTYRQYVAIPWVYGMPGRAAAPAAEPARAAPAPAHAPAAPPVMPRTGGMAPLFPAPSPAPSTPRPASAGWLVLAALGAGLYFLYR